MRKLILFLLLMFSFAPALANDFTRSNFGTMTNMLSADIDDFGKSLRESNFTPDGQLVPNFVPIEAKVGRFFMSALSEVARAVYTGLLPFLNALIIALFAFWIFMESWQMMRGDNDYWSLSTRIVKKGAIIAIWLWILNNNPADIFMLFLWQFKIT